MGNLTVGPAITLQQDRLRFPGMLPREVLVMKAWLVLHEAEYDRFDYNVRLGQGTDPGPNWPPEIRQQAIQNTQKRIDAVAWKGNQPTLIEVKDRAGFSAIGQLVGYDALWPQSFPNSPVPKLLLVANRAAADIYPVVAKAGIVLELVAVDFSLLAIRSLSQ